MALTVSHTAAEHAWVARPNRSLALEQTRRLVFFAAVISGGIAVAFACVGAWPILPFAGLEVAALWLALRHQQRHADDEERIVVDETWITVTCIIGGETETHRFPRYWAQLQIEREAEYASPGRGGARLFIRSHGRALEIGRLLAEAQRRALAESIRKQLGTTE